MKQRLLILIAIVAGCVVPLDADTSGVPPQPKWWKGNLHTHTFWSDGHDFPEMVAQWYKENGYHFLALSDHNILSRGQKWIAIDQSEDPVDWIAYEKYLKALGPEWVETRSIAPGQVRVRLKPISEYRALVEEAGRFLMIEGEEITDGAENDKSIHMNATNLGEYIAPPGGETVEDVIRRSLALVRAQEQRLGREILFHVNHLNYKWGVTAHDLAAVTGTRFFEVWNGVDSDNDPGDAEHASTDEKWDMANTLRLHAFNAAPLYGLATDDTHDYHGERTRAIGGRGWIMVRARFLTPESIIRAMRAGDFYASTGVVLRDVSFEDGALRLEIEPVGNEVFTTKFVGTIEGEEDAPGVLLMEVKGTVAEYRLTGNELYVRAIVTSNAAPDVPSTEFPFKRAWTQPVGWRDRVGE